MTYQERVNQKYTEFEEFYSYPQFSVFQEQYAKSAFLIRQIVKLEMRCEQLVEKVNLLLDYESKCIDKKKLKKHDIS